MTKTIVLTVLMTAAAHGAAAQSFPTPAPVPTPFLAAPIVAAPVVAAPVVTAPVVAVPEPPEPPQAPEPFVFGVPPELPDLSQIQLPDLSNLDIRIPNIQIPDLSFLSDLQIPDVSIDVDQAIKGAQKALEKLPKTMAMLQNPNPLPQPPQPPQLPQGPFQRAGKFFNEENGYDQARNAIERDQYERAVSLLDQVIEAKGTRVEAAMYWKAYSLSKLSRRPEALMVLADLQKQFPSGQWVRDAKALDVELKQASGQSVSADSVDDETKVFALRALMQGNPDQALPQIEKLLQGTSSVRVKQSALILLGQSSSPRARAALVNVAKNGSNPDLRLSAVRYMGNRNDPETVQALEEIYRSTNDRDMKQQILRSFMTTNAVDKLAAVARTEKDDDLQRQAVRLLGSTNRSEAVDALRAIYTSDASIDTKKAVIDALSVNRNAAATFVQIIKAEKNPELKKYGIQRMGNNTRSPEIQQFLADILDGK